MVKSNGEDMNTLSELLQSSAVQAHVSKTLTFAEIANAYIEIESGRTVDKIVITIKE